MTTTTTSLLEAAAADTSVESLDGSIPAITLSNRFPVVPAEDVCPPSVPVVPPLKRSVVDRLVDGVKGDCLVGGKGVAVRFASPLERLICLGK